MQRGFKTAVALSLSLGLFGSVGLMSCSKKSAPPAGPAAVPAAPPVVAHVIAWELTLKSSCATGVAAEDCLASQGFSVNADGAFKVGPAENARVLTGTLTDAELKGLNDKLARAELIPVEGQATSSSAQTEQKVSRTEGETNDVLTLTLASQDAKQVIHTNGADFFFITGAREAQAIETAAGIAQALQDELHRLALTHYPLPFPNACGDKVDEVKSNVYSALQTCQADADCSYMDWNTDSAIPTGTHQFVITDNGNYLPPLIVANSTSLADPALYGKLMEANTQIDAVCKFQRPDYTQQKGFFADQAAPVCDTSAKVCKVNPAIPL